MSRFPAFLLVVQVRDDGMARKCLEREWRDKAQGVGRHDDMNIAALLRELAGQIRSFVGCNRTGDAEYNIFAHRAGASNSGGWTRPERICSASTIASIRRKSS